MFCFYEFYIFTCSKTNPFGRHKWYFPGSTVQCLIFGALSFRATNPNSVKDKYPLKTTKHFLKNVTWR